MSVPISCVIAIMIMECPSGGALASASAPMMPVAPGRLSASTGCPQYSV
jgi:hypothetical protein